MARIKRDICAQLITDLTRNLQPSAVGFGCDVHSETERKEWSTAYAVLLSASLRLKDTDVDFGIPLTHTEVIEQSATWLIKNRGCASTQLPVWSLPYPRKIWEDSTPCLPNTGFCVPSTHCLQALCEVATGIVSSKSVIRSDAQQAAYESAQAFANTCFSNTGNGLVFWYSTLFQHSFHVPNATSMMAGQIQKTAAVVGGDAFLEEQATLAVSELLSLADDVEGVLTWNYFGRHMPSNKKNRRNDLLHEAFVCHGLMEYKSSGGRLGDSYSYDDLLCALSKFVRDDAIFDFPTSEQSPRRLKQMARVIGVAHALYVVGELCLRSESVLGYELLERLLGYLVENLIIGDRILYRVNDRDVTHYIRTKGHIILALAQAHQVLEFKG